MLLDGETEICAVIKRHICFNVYDGDIDTPYEKFNAGIDKVREKSLALFSDVFIYSLDEMRVISKSKRNKYKTFMQSKPIKSGVDIFTISCASQRHHGLVHSTLPYCGKKTYDPNLRTVDGIKGGKMDSIICKLMGEVHKTGDEIVVMDNRFTSIYVAETLSKHFGGMGIAGVIKKNRKCLPKTFLESEEIKAELKRMNRGDYMQFMCVPSGENSKRMHLTVWKDTKILYLLDNCINPYRESKVCRTDKSGVVTEYVLPYICKLYNKHMGEVDASSAHKSIKTGYPIDIKHKRNHTRLFWSLFESYCLVNPSILLSDIYDEKKVYHHRNRKSLVNKWITDHIQYQYNNGYKRKARAKKPSVIVENTLAACLDGIRTHCLKKYVDGSKVQCYKCKKTCKYVCDTCIPQIGFCNHYTNRDNRDCFGTWHNQYFPFHHHSNKCNNR